MSTEHSESSSANAWSDELGFRMPLSVDPLSPTDTDAVSALSQRLKAIARNISYECRFDRDGRLLHAQRIPETDATLVSLPARQILGEFQKLFSEIGVPLAALVAPPSTEVISQHRDSAREGVDRASAGLIVEESIHSARRSFVAPNQSRRDFAALAERLAAQHNQGDLLPAIRRWHEKNINQGKPTSFVSATIPTGGQLEFLFNGKPVCIHVFNRGDVTSIQVEGTVDEDVVLQLSREGLVLRAKSENAGQLQCLPAQVGPCRIVMAGG